MIELLLVAQLATTPIDHGAACRAMRQQRSTILTMACAGEWEAAQLMTCYGLPQTCAPMSSPPEPPAVMIWPVPEHHEWWLHTAIFGSGVAAASDLGVTEYAIGMSGNQFVEANPMLRWASGDPVLLAVTKASIDGAVIWLAIKHHGKHPKLVLAVALAKTAISAWAAHKNAKTLGLR